MQQNDFRVFKRVSQAATLLVWLLAVGLGMAWGLKLLDRSKATPADAREVSLEPPAVAVSWASLAAHFGVAPAAAAAPVAQTYKVLGVVLDAAGARAVMLPDQADAKSVVVKVGDKLPGAERVQSITTTEVIAKDAAGRELRFAVPKREEAKPTAVVGNAPGAMRVPTLPGGQPIPGQRFAPPPPPPSSAMPAAAAPPNPVALPGQSLGNLPQTEGMQALGIQGQKPQR